MLQIQGLGAGSGCRPVQLEKLEDLVVIGARVGAVARITVAAVTAVWASPKAFRPRPKNG